MKKIQACEICQAIVSLAGERISHNLYCLRYHFLMCSHGAYCLQILISLPHRTQMQACRQHEVQVTSVQAQDHVTPLPTIYRSYVSISIDIIPSVEQIIMIYLKNRNACGISFISRSSMNVERDERLIEQILYISCLIFHIFAWLFLCLSLISTWNVCYHFIIHTYYYLLVLTSSSISTIIPLRRRKQTRDVQINKRNI